jgi:flavin reductase (DIM6/NTAB) family NADH-FMN oxidoreductase RutF
VSDVDQAAFRRATGQFPGGIVIVTTSAGHAMTVSAFASVSLEPPLVLFCAEKIARFHDAVLEAGAWAVSILAEDGEKAARWLATRGRPLKGQLDELPHHPGPATGAPVLDGALAVLECQTFAVYDGGDHSIVVGRVTAVDGQADPPASGSAPGSLDPSASGSALGSLDPSASGSALGSPARGPLIHYAGRYHRLRPAEG